MESDRGTRADRSTSRLCWRTLPLALLLAAAIGCAESGPSTGPRATTGTLDVEQTEPELSSTAQPNETASPPVVDPQAPAVPDQPPASAIRVQVAGVEEYDATLQSLRGQVVLVDFWATWCIPCVQQFPHTVSLSQKHRDQGLAVISVSMNDPSEEASVLSFLRNRQAEFHNFLGKYGAGTEFAESFDLRGDIPFYKLYDRSGRLRYQFSAEPEGIENGLNISEMDRHVEQLLAEESP